MASTDSPDPYIDPKTGLLRNSVNAHPQSSLSKIEAAASFARQLSLVNNPAPLPRNLQGLQKIHYWLFQDVYPWAGEVRTVDIRKPVGRKEPFAPAKFILVAANNAFSDLHVENYLKGMSRSQFIQQLAHHYDQLNYIHPFREGNGRTLRLFFSQLADEAGWHILWDDVLGETNDEACRIAVEERKLAPLQHMFNEIVSRN